MIPSRRAIAGASALAVGGAFMSVATAPSAMAAVTPSGVNVNDYGAKGDGVTDDSDAVKIAIDKAGGDLVFFPSGTYVLDRIQVAGRADLLLGVGAVLLHKENSPGNYMFEQIGPFFRIRGGTVDGNKAKQSGRPFIIASTLTQERHLILEGVHFRNVVKACVYIQKFGGECNMNNCLITDMAQHDGVAGHATAVIQAVSGEANSKATLRYNHNRAIFTDTPMADGSNPGGVFLNVGDPDTGMKATFEAIGNYFYGYGQNLAGNFISALHTYPFVRGARWVGNYFEASSYPAMSAKSVEDFVCTGNVVIDGVVSAANVASEGAICYAPSYHGGGVAHPRAVIDGNIVQNPGGQPDRVQNGISVLGSSTSKATQVVVSNNVLNGVGMGVHVINGDGVMLNGNVISNTASTSSYHGGIRADYCGELSLQGNHVTSNSGYGLYMAAGMENALVSVQNNVFRHKIKGIYAMAAMGLKSMHSSGNVFEAPSHAVTFRGWSGTPLQRVMWDPTNQIISGAFVPYWDEITAVYGEFSYVNSPQGAVAAGEAGARYTAKNLPPGQVYWIATKAGKDGWVAIA
jgi:hypothetical protein